MVDLELIDKIKAEIERRLNRKLTEREAYNLDMAVETDWDCWHLGGGRDPETYPYGEKDLTWLDRLEETPEYQELLRQLDRNRPTNGNSPTTETPVSASTDQLRT